MSKHKLIIGVDFGTTYTGVSYVMSSSSTINDIHIIRTWPGPGREADAGYQVTPKMKGYCWTKLLLDTKSSLTEYDDPDLQVSQGEGFLKLPPGRTATELCGDFLKEVYQYTLAHLKKRLTAPVVDMTPIQFWFTVPAIWSDAAKAATWKAAKMGGFGSRIGDTVNFIPEPEAAAVATLSAMSSKNSATPLCKGEAIVICDCGGGTVDVITYMVTNTQPLRFEELVVGIGGKRGSTFIDRNFHSWMSVRFGTAFDNLAAEKKGTGSRFMREFELYKHDFGHSDNSDAAFEVPLVMHKMRKNSNYDAEESCVKFSRKEMCTFFDPAVEKIKQLLKQQFDAVHHEHPHKKITKLIHVGGFGDSPYLNKQLALWCKSQGSIQLLCPDSPQAAVVKGAAFRGLQGIKASKKRSRLHYGIRMMLPFRQGTDPELLAYYDPWYNGEKFCKNRAVWQIKKGQVIDQTSKMSQSIEVTNRDDENPSFSADLYCCKSDIAPEYTSHKDVEIVGTLDLQFSKSDLQHFRSREIDGVKHWKLEYDLQIHLAPLDGLLHVRAVMKGNREIGVTRIRYESEMQ